MSPDAFPLLMLLIGTVSGFCIGAAWMYRLTSRAVDEMIDKREIGPGPRFRQPNSDDE